MKCCKEVFLFLLVSVLSCLAVFQDAMWGRSIAAPIDLAPALWKHYHYVDPEQGPIPKNHYIVDQLGYDLPLQYVMYHAWRSGEVPWWNPYTLGGRPLLADAHCNGTDPIRLVVYFSIPDFILAYNWTLILHCMGTGLGFFVLLRGIGVRSWLAGACALAAQWAGGYVLYIGHPWVRGTFLYYPFLWLAWQRAMKTGRFSIAAPFLVAAIFYSGNLQSHAYLPIFVLAVGAGYAGSSPRRWWEFLRITSPAAVLGSLMAGLVLVPQIELYLLNDRIVPSDALGWNWLETAATLAGVHPWAAGTFRTISLKSVSGGISFHLAVGGGLVILGLYGWAKRKHRPGDHAIFATGAWVILAFLLIVLTPLHYFLYLRAAGLGVLGLIVLAALGGEILLQSRQKEVRWSRAVCALMTLIVIGTTVLAFGVYPRFKNRVQELLMSRAESDGYGGASRELRKFQARNFAREVSVQNPECALNLAGLGFLALAFAAGASRRGAVGLGFTLGLSMLSQLMFAERFIARAPMETWEGLLEGGPVQKPIVARFVTSGARLADEALQEYTRVFPQEVAALHRLHVVHGYAALQPLHALGIESAEVRYDVSGEMEQTGNARFYWKSGSKREVRIDSGSLNRLRIVFPPGPADALIRMDTWYPGWTADGHSLKAFGPDDIFSEIPVAVGQTTALCEYRPTGHRISVFAVIAGVASSVLLAWRSNGKTLRLS